MRTTTTNQQPALVDSSSNQVMLTVMANIETVLETVTILVNRVIALRDHNAFPYGMTAADHELIFIVLGSNSNEMTSIGSTIYIALDDGTAFATYALYGERGIAYREPGNSGYSIHHMQESDPYYKYYITCLNLMNGEPRNCTMKENTTYVECINHCEPIPCNTTTKNHHNEHSNITYMCRHYEIKVVEENNTLGYIPFTSYCVNQYYQPEQRPGYVVIGNDEDGNANSFGDCLYQDYRTLVNRTIRGDYAFCRPNRTCDTTYQGGFDEEDRDLRLDPIYQQTKAAQGPTWTSPIVSGYATLSISYNLPIYTQPKLIHDTITDNSNLLLFEGVIGSSLDLSPITEFLQKTIPYDNTGQRVFIVENIEPYHVVGSSMQHYMYNTTIDGCEYCDKITFDGVVKWVLISNPSKICPYVDGSLPYNLTDIFVNCTTIHTSINEFFDKVSRRAFQKYYEINFISDQKGIYFKEDDDDHDAALGTQAYVAYSRLYSKQNLQWHVFVVSQVNRSTTDALLKGNLMFPVICIIATIGFITCFIMFYCLYQKRTERAVIHADWRFTCAFIIGCAFINCSSYTLLGENTNQLCMLRMWSFNGLFVCALSPLFVKVWRMAKLLKASIGFQRTTVTNFQAFLYTLPLIVLEFIFLMIVSIVDPPHASEELGVGDGIGYHVVQCSQKNNVFVYLQTIFHGSLVLVGCVLAYLTRDLDPKYGEAKQLAFSMYNIAFTGLTTILIISLVELDQVSKIVVQTVSVLWGSCFCSLAFVLPRLLQVQHDHKEAEKRSTSSHATSYVMPIAEFTNRSSMGVFDATLGETTERNTISKENRDTERESYQKLIDTKMECVVGSCSISHHTSETDLPNIHQNQQPDDIVTNHNKDDMSESGGTCQD